ncbi:antitoxin VapB family protein [Candidatus Woesearchaeota archaeon]|nr:antitoxin VapB family protein [Candidatus Woesearchaeota archaeon]
MATKTITVTEDAYAVLARQKKEDESFSEEIVRLLKKKGSILELAGAWGKMPQDIAGKMLSEIRESRSKWGARQKARLA